MDQTVTPPYARIAAELREQIVTGRLPPGHRVPSTREITRRWGVAMATATKALTALRQEGLVTVVPGVGTVVDEVRPARAGQPGPLRPQPARRPGPDGVLASGAIVDAAVRVADREGLAALSMRRVAAEMAVATMSLYRHVADKEDLLLRMMGAAIEESPLPHVPPDGWRPRLELAGRMLWATFRRHPWLATAMSLTRPQPVASGMAYTEWVLAALDGCPVDADTMLTIHLVLFNYVRGTAVNLELEAEAEAASGLNSEEWLATQQSALRSIVAGRPFPMIERVLSSPYPFDLDVLFEFGLQRLLDGVGLWMGGGPAH